MSLHIRWKYLAWRLCHPFRPFSEYYARTVGGFLENGGAHATLGSNIRNEDTYQRTAEIQLAFLQSRGLRPTSRIIDYGCGSLRLGKLLIDFLEPDGYIGLDATDQFYAPALASLDRELRDTKRPRCYTISPEVIEELQPDPVDFIISTHVLIHVPWEEMRDFLSRFDRLAGKKTKIYIDFHDGAERKHFHELTWAYPARDLCEVVTGLGRKVTVIEPAENDFCRQLAGFYKDDFRILEIR